MSDQSVLLKMDKPLRMERGEWVPLRRTIDDPKTVFNSLRGGIWTQRPAHMQRTAQVQPGRRGRVEYVRHKRRVAESEAIDNEILAARQRRANGSGLA